MRRRAPLCDRCGLPLSDIADSIVRLRFDHRDVLVEAGLDHCACAGTAAEPGERIETIGAAEVAGAVTAARLAELARLHDAASVTRVVRKAVRLAGISSAGASL
jgi:hypothetical protein